MPSPKRAIRTFDFEGLPERGDISLETATFEALPGDRTRVATHSVFLSVAGRDGMIGSGMEQGGSESRGRLDELPARDEPISSPAVAPPLDNPPAKR